MNLSPFIFICKVYRKWFCCLMGILRIFPAEYYIYMRLDISVRMPFWRPLFLVTLHIYMGYLCHRPIYIYLIYEFFPQKLSFACVIYDNSSRNIHQFFFSRILMNKYSVTRNPKMTAVLWYIFNIELPLQLSRTKCYPVIIIHKKKHGHNPQLQNNKKKLAGRKYFNSRENSNYCKSSTAETKRPFSPLFS